MWLAQLLHRVTQYIGYALNSFLRTYNHHAVTHLQLHALIRYKVNSCAIDTRNVDAIFCAQTQIGEFLAVDAVFRDDDASRYKLRLGIRRCFPLFLRHVYRLTEECCYRLLVLRRAYYTQFITHDEPILALRDGYFAILVHYARDYE